jgi:hypothetical protein
MSFLAVGKELLAKTFCHPEPAFFAGEASVVVAIAGELGDDGVLSDALSEFELHDSRRDGIRTRNRRIMK